MMIRAQDIVGGMLRDFEVLGRSRSYSLRSAIVDDKTHISMIEEYHRLIVIATLRNVK
jgi:hypothetical protein